MIPLKRRIPHPKNSQYRVRKDGSLLCGPACFSKANILKRRFETVSEAEKFLVLTGQTDAMQAYNCDYCKGVHLTGVKR